MNCEQRYKDIIDAVKKLREANPSDEGIQNWINENFPELEESKDEKIRKELLEHCKKQAEIYNTLLTGKEYGKVQSWIAWLEKQDYTFEIKEGHWYKCVCDYMLNGTDLLMFKNDRLYYCRRDWRLRGEIDERNVKDIGVHGYKSFFRPATNQEIKDWLEKQGEQKPVDKVAPKFKNGDYVVDNCGYVWKIEGILNQFYILEGIDGGESRPTIDWVDKTFHLWDITKDAKEGDVLVDKSGGRECPFIFKETKPSNIKTDILQPLTVLGYCGIGGAGFTKGSGWGDTVNCTYYPATKEQRDKLEKAMAEAGYEFGSTLKRKN